MGGTCTLGGSKLCGKKYLYTGTVTGNEGLGMDTLRDGLVCGEGLIVVGACVFLHAQNISAEDIKFRLRWRSDSFRMYLRNIIQLAERHRDAIRNA